MLTSPSSPLLTVIPCLLPFVLLIDGHIFDWCVLEFIMVIPLCIHSVLRSYGFERSSNVGSILKLIECSYIEKGEKLSKMRHWGVIIILHSPYEFLLKMVFVEFVILVYA